MLPMVRLTLGHGRNNTKGKFFARSLHPKFFSLFQKHTTQLGTLGDLTVMMGGSGSLFTFGRSSHQQTRLPLQLFWARI
ncbi:unnamed protein product [Calypogeia fissa]